MLRVVVVAVAFSALASSADASPRTGFAFGRYGGNIRPFTVRITTEGVVRSGGPVTVGRSRLTRLQLGELNRLAATTRFGTLPRSTSCPQALPDVARTFIRVGPRTVSVHGTCLRDYQRLWKALARAVELTQT